MSTLSNTLMQHIRDKKNKTITIDATDRRVVIDNLVFLYDCVVATENLLTHAAARASSLPSTAFHDHLAGYFRSHLPDEQGHAQWLAEDLLFAGINAESRLLADDVAMAMVGTQYYLLHHAHPAALLGYMAVVEGDPVPLHIVSLLERTHGEKLLRFVRIHANTDLEHRLHLFRVIDDSPAHLHDLIIYSANSSLDHFATATTKWASNSSTP